MIEDRVCASCSHRESAHQIGLFGVRCIGRHWFETDKSEECACSEFTEEKNNLSPCAFPINGMSCPRLGRFLIGDAYYCWQHMGLARKQQTASRKEAAYQRRLAVLREKRKAEKCT